MSQKQKAIDESMLVEELKLSKELLNKVNQDLETKKNALNTELEEPKVSKAWTQTVSDSNEVSDVKTEESKTNIKEKKKAIPCKCFF